MLHFLASHQRNALSVQTLATASEFFFFFKVLLCLEKQEGEDVINIHIQIKSTNYFSIRIFFFLTSGFKKRKEIMTESEVVSPMSK